jgi:hypothetical protein
MVILGLMLLVFSACKAAAWAVESLRLSWNCTPAAHLAAGKPAGLLS